MKLRQRYRKTRPVTAAASVVLAADWRSPAAPPPARPVSSPSPFCATCDSLTGVAASSAKNAWAVGTLNAGGEVVILHWNGIRWANYTSANVLANT